MFDRSPPDFKVDIMGSEIEWGIAAFRKDGSSYMKEFYDKDLAGKLITKCIPKWLVPQHFDFLGLNRKFLFSGDLFYLDTGHHVETSTAEGKDPLSMVLYEKRCERTVEEMVNLGNALWKDEGFYIRSFKNNVDSCGNSYGAHANFHLPRIPGVTYPLSFLHDNLIPHLISQQLYAGNGRVATETKEAEIKLRYLLSQRSLFIVTTEGGGSTASRPIISTRDEPHADQYEYIRLHIPSGDSLLNQTAIFLKFGTTAIILEMIIHEFLGKTPFGQNTDGVYIFALHKFSYDSALRTVCRLGEKTYDIIDLQEFYLEKALKFYRTREDLLTPDKKLVLKLWGEILRLARSENPAETLSLYVDWAAKKCWIDMDMERFGYGWNSDPFGKITITLKNKEREEDTLKHLLAIDLRYHENSPKGYARILEERGCTLRLVDEKKIQKFRRRPLPHTTRACARSEALYRHEALAVKLGLQLNAYVDWTVFTPQDHKHRSFDPIKMIDPRDFRLNWPELQITKD